MLSKLDSADTCVKCGAWVKGTSARAKYECLGVWSVEGKVIMREECIVRTCPRCDYEWKEQCLDSV